MKKKIIYFVIILLVMVTFWLVNQSIEKNDTVLQKVKLIIPINIRNKLKETIFVFKNQETLKKEISEASKKNNEQLEKIFLNKIINNEIVKTQMPKETEELIKIRNLINKKYILDESQITYAKIDNFKNNFDGFKHKPSNKYEIFSLNYYEINHFAILEKSKKRTKKLLIYNQGHGGNPYDFSYFIEIKNKFLSEGYDVMSLTMTGLGYNKDKKINFPNFNPEFDASLHKSYSTYYDPKFPNKKPLSLILSGNYFLIKKIINNNLYDEVIMVGFSGGGWYTTLISSLITEIDKSYSFAGTVPLLFRLFDTNYGDWEQIDSSIYEIVDYNSFYVLSTMDEIGNFTREHYQIYNDKDTCCFKNPAAKILKKIYKEINIKNFEILIVNNEKHTINTDYFFEKFFNY